MLFFTLSDTDVDFLNPLGASVEDLHHRKGPPNYQTRRASGSERVAAIELDPEYETYIVHVGSVSSNASPSYSLGSYVGLHQVCQLCVLSRLGFRTPRAYWDQR